MSPARGPWVRVPHPPPFYFAPIAQLVERLFCKQGVIGSNPVGGTISAQYLSELDGPHRRTIEVQWVTDTVQIHFGLVAQRSEQAAYIASV